MAQQPHSSALEVHATWPPAPRLLPFGSSDTKPVGLSFRSASGRRIHPRIALPATVEIEGISHALADLSVGGFALEGDARIPGAGDATFEVVFRLGKPHLSLAIKATAKAVRASAGTARSFEIVDVSPDAATALERLVAIWLSGSQSLTDALSRTALEAPPPPEEAARNWRSLVAFAAAGLGLIIAAGYVASSRLMVYSEFGAISAPMSMVRAPQPGLLILQAGAAGTVTEPGQVLGELRPSLPRQFLGDTENQIHLLEARLGQLRAELVQGEAGFAAFRAQAETDFAAANETRRLMERQVATQERLFNRLAGLSRQGYVSALRADQEEMNLVTQRRALAEARAAEQAAQILLGEARAGRFRGDGRPTARSPEEVRREAAAVTASLAEMRATLARLAAPIPLVSPCLCRIAQVAVPSGTEVVAGDVLLGLAEDSGRAIPEVDALVPAARMSFLAQGQKVSVRLAGSRHVTPARIIALNHNPENTGRIGLPDNLRSLRIYGLVTLALEEEPAGITATIGLPALLQAPVSLRMLLLNLPGFSWIARLGD